MTIGYHDREYVINIQMNDLVSKPERGAVCGNSARTDLCGGRWVTGVPTATLPALQAEILNLFIPRALPWAVAVLALQAVFYSRDRYKSAQRAETATDQGNALGMSRLRIAA